MSERTERSALNEALFREVNERVDERRGLLDDDDLTTFVCECAEMDCSERIQMTRAEYRAVHEHPARFVVLPGHVAVDVEQVVLRTERYEVVEKRGVAGEVAEALQNDDGASVSDPADESPD